MWTRANKPFIMKQLLFFIAAALSHLTIMAQMVTTEGTDFWLAVEPNWSNSDVDFYTFAAGGKRNCTVTIANPNTGWSYTMNVTANQVTKYQLPTSINSQVWQAGSCTVLNTGLHITSTDTIQFYFFNHSGSEHASDASTIFPTEALGVDYIVQSYPVNNSTYNSFSYFSILATEDGTTVDITMNGNTNTTIHSGDHVSVALNAGQVYQVLSTENTGDLSGTTIHSDSCHPIAVFSGITLGRVPINGLSSDHCFQQCFPTSTWANDWILTPSAHHDIDYVRVTAAANNCQIFLNGSTTPTATIQAAQTHEFSITSATRVHTSQPASVFQYIDSRHSTSQGGDHGDASSFAPTPLGMTTRYVTFPTFHVESRYPSTNQYYANVIVPTTETSLLRYNGSPISASFSTIPGTTYSHIRFPITESGQHLLTTTGSGFIGHTYGVGENWDSYVFSLGGSDTSYQSAMLDSITTDTVEITHCGDSYQYRSYVFTHSVDTLIPVACSLVVFRLTLITPTYYDIDTAVCDSQFVWHGHTYRSSGHYRDTISSLTGGCDTVFRLSLSLRPNYHFTIDTSVCPPALRWGDTIIQQPGTHTLAYTTEYGCDSIYTISLDFLATADTTIDTVACPGTSLLLEGEELEAPGMYTFHYRAANGCDSTVNLNIRAYPTYDTTYYVSIADTEQYLWIDGREYTEAIDTLLVFIDRNGCDSILRLSLEVNIIPQAPIIWVPNVITPSKAENSRFRVLSKNVNKMTVSIYHRQGQHICTFDGITDDWDGTYRGQPCPQGTYVYHITYQATELSQNATNRPIVGTVTIIR